MPRTDIPWVGSTEIVLPSAARAGSGNSGALSGYGPASTLRAQLDVTAFSGTAPTLDVVLEDTLDGGATWNVVGTFSQKTGVAREVINITTPFSDTLRARWTEGGTGPSFTFSLAVVAQ